MFISEGHRPTDMAEIGVCPVCDEEKSLEVWHRPLPYGDHMLTRACTECYVQHLWAYRDHTADD